MYNTLFLICYITKLTPIRHFLSMRVPKWQHTGGQTDTHQIDKIKVIAFLISGGNVQCPYFGGWSLPRINHPTFSSDIRKTTSNSATQKSCTQKCSLKRKFAKVHLEAWFIFIFRLWENMRFSEFVA